jgi:hypothetical protein
MNTSLISDRERREYGDDLLDLVGRKALETFKPYSDRLQAENADLRRRLHVSEAKDIYTLLDEEFGQHWRTVNTHPDFLAWLQIPDPYSNAPKAGLLRTAFAAGDAPRVAVFFRNFLREHPEYARGSQTRRSGSRSFASNNSGGGGEWTTSMIEDLYRQVREGRFKGREDELARIEANLSAAVNAGRVRRA